jgi:hypothetical protein
MDMQMEHRDFPDTDPDTSVVLLAGWAQRMMENATAPNVDRVIGKPPKLALLHATLAELTNPKPT